MKIVQQEQFVQNLRDDIKCPVCLEVPRSGPVLLTLHTLNHLFPPPVSMMTLLNRKCQEMYLQDDKELDAFSVWVVESKVLDQEVNMYTKKGAAWSDFRVTSKTKQQVEGYLRNKMDKYTKGEVYKRQK